MRPQFLLKWVAMAVLGVGLTLGHGIAQTLGNLFQMVGGMDTVKKLGGDFLQSAAKDPRLSGVLGKADTSTMAPKLGGIVAGLDMGAILFDSRDIQITPM